MSMKKPLLLLILLSTLIMAACVKRPEPEVGPLDRLDTIENLTQNVNMDEEQEGQQMRKEMLRDAALSLGARGGLAARTEQINADLEQEAEYLDTVFNFQGLLLPNNVLPPVLVEGRDALNLDGPYVIRVADRNYRIVKQAKFVTAVPRWEDYLFLPVHLPEPPDKKLLPDPKEDDEVALWKEYTREGWEQGIQQADEIYNENLARLKRDYTGMIRYRKLLAQNMVSAPLVAERDLGVTGGGDQLAVNDRILTIKALPSLKANTEQWSPTVSQTAQ